jgi:2-dehydro-3-deoxygalactonokinase
MKTISAGNAAQRNHPHAAICVDMGTTNTRAWLVVEQEIVARQSASIGVRDSARTGSTNIIHSTLKGLFGALQAQAQSSGYKAAVILGAGMITSSLGLREIDHVPAPAGEQELARSMQQISDSQITELPIWLVPGVRTGPLQPEITDLPEVDVIRGEETLCVGLTHLGMLGPHATLLNLGSHWKAITLDGSGRIASSFTTLSGELIHAVQQHTVLSSALPQDRFTEVDVYWLEQGCAQQKLSGLSRALFCVRILQQKFSLTPLQCSSFLVGAVVGSDLTAARNNHKLAEKIVIAGSGAAAEAWKQFLEAENRVVAVWDAQGVEAAFVAGLLRLAELAPRRSS